MSRPLAVQKGMDWYRAVLPARLILRLKTARVACFTSIMSWAAKSAKQQATTLTGI